MNNEEQLDYINILIGEIENTKHISKSLRPKYPIAIVGAKSIKIYDLLDRTDYSFVKEVEKPDFLPNKVLAAFNLNEYDNKMAAIIHQEALKSREGRIFIQHEFVHCFQYENGEMRFKNELDIYKNAMIKKDYMWEILHPFPYGDSEIVENLKNLAMIKDRDINIKNIEEQLEKIVTQLSVYDQEYMIWQIWKEGYARYIENLLRENSSLQENFKIYEDRIDRTIFYQIGDIYFSALSSTEDINITKCFNNLKSMISNT